MLRVTGFAFLALVVAGTAQATPFIIGGGEASIACGSRNSCGVSTVSDNSPTGEFSGTLQIASQTATLGFQTAWNAEFGILGTSSTAIIDFATAGAATVRAAARFTDDITISSPGMDGQEGLLYLSYDLDGTFITSGVALPGLLAVSEYDTNLSLVDRQVHFSPNGTGTFMLAPLSFVYGEAFSFTLQMDAYARSNSVVGTGLSRVLFLHTLILSGMLPTDLSGNVISGATFSSASGTVYGLNGVQTPEPSSLILLGLGLFGSGRRLCHLRARSK